MNICIGMTPSIVNMSSHFNGPSLNFCLTFESSTKKKIVNQVVINFEINVISLSNRLFYIAKRSTQKFKYLVNEMRF